MVVKREKRTLALFFVLGIFHTVLLSLHPSIHCLFIFLPVLIRDLDISLGRSRLRKESWPSLIFGTSSQLESISTHPGHCHKKVADLPLLPHYQSRFRNTGLDMTRDTVVLDVPP